MIRISEYTAEIIYLVLITLTAIILYSIYVGLFDEDWIYGRDHSGSNIPDSHSIYPGLFMGTTALVSGWQTWRMIKPATWKSYLLCGLVNIPLFHICLGILIFLWLIVVFLFVTEDSEISFVNMLNTGLFWGATAGAVSLVRCCLITSWICLQTAIITKIVLSLIDSHIKRG